MRIFNKDDIKKVEEIKQEIEEANKAQLDRKKKAEAIRAQYEDAIRNTFHCFEIAMKEYPHLAELMGLKPKQAYILKTNIFGHKKTSKGPLYYETNFIVGEPWEFEPGLGWLPRKVKVSSNGELWISWENSKEELLRPTLIDGIWSSSLSNYLVEWTYGVASKQLNIDEMGSPFSEQEIMNSIKEAIIKDVKEVLMNQ
jgi:hypothetical protein